VLRRQSRRQRPPGGQSPSATRPGGTGSQRPVYGRNGGLAHIIVIKLLDMGPMGSLNLLAAFGGGERGGVAKPDRLIPSS